MTEHIQRIKPGQSQLKHCFFLLFIVVVSCHIPGKQTGDNAPVYAENDSLKCGYFAHDSTGKIMYWAVFSYDYRINMQTTSSMSFTLERSDSIESWEYYIHKPGSNVPDSLHYTLDKRNFNRSYMIFTRVNSGYIKKEDHYVESRDTVQLHYKDSVHYAFRGRGHYLLKFYGVRNDSFYYTVYFSDTVGVVKQYSNYHRHSFELFRGTYEYCYGYKFLDTLFNTFISRESFHTRVDNGERTLHATLISAPPRKGKQKSKKEIITELLLEQE